MSHELLAIIVVNGLAIGLMWLLSKDWLFSRHEADIRREIDRIDDEYRELTRHGD